MTMCHNLYYSQNIISVIKVRKMTWEGLGNKRNAYKVLILNHEEERHPSEDTRISGKILE